LNQGLDGEENVASFSLRLSVERLVQELLESSTFIRCLCLSGSSFST
jgi:hypothetical protein